jgi:acyl-CoA thioesterase-2
MAPVTRALDDLIALLDLEAIEVNIFRGVSPDEERQRVFGGQVAGQALVAAGRTVNDDTSRTGPTGSNGDAAYRAVHSLHAYFLRPGDPTAPILYEVDRLRDGRSFSTRRVVAIQHGAAIFNLSASFKVAEKGVAHQARMPSVAQPETLPPVEPDSRATGRRAVALADRPRPIDVRRLPDDEVPSDEDEPRLRVWMRADGRLPDDPLLHACVVAYASDITLLDTATKPHGLTFDGRSMASLDHAMWFHRPFRADGWLLYDQRSPVAAEARGLAIGELFDRDGRLVVSVVQEGLIRGGRSR